MSRIIRMEGMVFGRLVVLEKKPSRDTSSAFWLCKCQCGTEKIISGLKLRQGNTISCGCYKKSNKSHLTHGQANKSKTYKTWKEMRQRCTNPNADNYKWYGGRGIKICQEWNDYAVFLKDMGERPDGKTLDRINSDGDYEKSNCCWSTPKEQAKTNRGCFRKGRNKSMGLLGL